MEKLLPFLLFLPFGVWAQEVVQEPAVPKNRNWEIGVNTSVAFTAGRGWGYDKHSFLAGRGSISAYRNFTEGQVGLVAEAGLLSAGDGWYMAPHVVVNYRESFQKFYWYFGGAAGYVKEETSDRMYARLDLRGFLAGVQIGTVYGIGKRFGINAECGIRIKTINSVEILYDYDPPHTDVMPRGYTDVHFPVSVGVRYKF